jgi:hypothetical protein
MVERFNGRNADALKTNRFKSAVALEQTLLRYVHIYNQYPTQSGLDGRTLPQAMKNWSLSQMN